MNVGPRHLQMLRVVTSVVLLLPPTTAHVIITFPVARPPGLLPVHSFQVSAAHTKIVSHPLPNGQSIWAPGYHITAAIIGPVGGGAIVAPPIVVYNPPQFFEHRPIQYSASGGVTVAHPLKLLFTRFPPFIEVIVQRIQNYFSTYTHVSNEKYPSSPPDNKPEPSGATKTTTVAPLSATNEIPTTRTETPITTEEATTVAETLTIKIDPPLSNNAEPETATGSYGETNVDRISTVSSIGEQEESSSYEIPVTNPFK